MRMHRLALGALAVVALTIMAAATIGGTASAPKKEGAPSARIAEGSGFTSTLEVSRSHAASLKGALGIGFAPMSPKALGPAAEMPSSTSRLDTRGTSPASGRAAPSAFAFDRVAPNPVERGTLLSFALPKTSRVRIETFDVRGRRVNAARPEELGPGRYQRPWNGFDNDGRPLPPGIYLIRFAASAVDGSQSLDALRKVLMLR